MEFKLEQDIKLGNQLIKKGSVIRVASDILEGVDEIINYIRTLIPKQTVSFGGTSDERANFYVEESKKSPGSVMVFVGYCHAYGFFGPKVNRMSQKDDVVFTSPVTKLEVKRQLKDIIDLYEEALDEASRYGRGFQEFLKKSPHHGNPVYLD